MDPLNLCSTAISTARGLAKWWAQAAKGHTEIGAILDLEFGPGYHWQAQVTEMVPSVEFELVLIKAEPDWLNTTVRFQLIPSADAVEVHFCHQGWPERNDHYNISCYCWAMYLRLLKRYVEHGEFVEYAERLNV